jgi:hypothetical protein
MNRRVMWSLALVLAGLVSFATNLWVYSLTHHTTQFLFMFVGVFIAVAGLINVRRYWQRG